MIYSEPTKQKPFFTPVMLMTTLFFAIGFLGSCLTTHFFKTGFYAPVLKVYQTLLDGLQSLEIDSVSLFLLAAKKHLKYVLLLWFFAFTNIWKYFYRFFSLYLGIQQGLLLSFCLIMNGAAGLIGYLCFLMPQSLLLLPAYLLSVQCADRLHKELINRQSEYFPAKARGKEICLPQKKQPALRRLPSFLLCLALTMLGCLLEGYLNPPLLRLFFR